MMSVTAALAAALAIGLLGARLGPGRRRPRVPRGEGSEPSVMPARARRPAPVAVALALVVAITLAVGPSAACIAAAFGGLVVAHRRRQRTAGRRRAVAAALPDSIELLVLMIHAGLSPRQAVVEAAARAPLATRDGFVAITHRLQRGHPLGDAVTALVEAIGPAARPVADGIAAADRYGLPLAPLLDELSRLAHADRRRLAEADARTLPVRLSFPLVVCTLPSFALLSIVPAVMGTVSSLRGHAA